MRSLLPGFSFALKAAISLGALATVTAGPALAQIKAQANSRERPSFFSPYSTTSQYFRDKLALKPLPPVRLRIDPSESARDPGLLHYNFSQFSNHVRAVPLETGVIVASLLAVGVGGWQWGDSKFHVAREGWFGRSTHNGGMDKLGHAYTTYLIADLLAQRIRGNAGNGAGAEITGALVAFGLMAGVEVLDGFTKKYGFSREDLAANAAGAAFAVARAWIPGLREKVDFRLLYTPAYMERSGVTADNFFIPPYRRSLYLFAIKGSGFEALRATPLRYLEFHLGYAARGFHQQERALGHTKQRSFYAGIGLNVAEVLFGDGPIPNLAKYRDSEAAWMTQKFLEYYQLPYTSYYARR